MDSQFAFSLDGSNYRGSFASRKEARQAAIDAAHQLSEPPGVVFVGRVREVDPQASGHGTHVVREMTRRFRDATGESRYLADVTDVQRRELDAQLEQAIRGWLAKHELLPQGEKVDAISEYPLPLIGAATAVIG